MQGGTLYYGRVQRIRKKGKSKGYVEYKFPVEFTDPHRKDIKVIFQTYTVEECGNMSFSMSTINEVTAADVICQLNLEYDIATGMYVPNQEELSTIQDEALRLQEPKRKKTQHRRMTQQPEFDGTVRTIVQPSSTEDGPRRSGRQRVVISHLT